MVFVDFVLENKRTKVIFPVLERLVGNMNSYPLGDFLIRFKNMVLAGKKEFSVPRTKLIYAVAQCLKDLGYINEIKSEDKELKVQIAYRRKQPVLIELSTISRPGFRVYKSVDELVKRRKPSTLILSTPLGVLSLKDALKKRVGGEVLLEIL